eukprot:341632-Amphidinium_carterae.1
MIWLLATYHKEKLYRPITLKDAECTNDDIELLHRNYNVRRPGRQCDIKDIRYDLNNCDKMQN